MRIKSPHSEYYVPPMISGFNPHSILEYLDVRYWQTGMLNDGRSEPAPALAAPGLVQAFRDTRATLQALHGYARASSAPWTPAPGDGKPFEGISFNLADVPPGTVISAQQETLAMHRKVPLRVPPTIFEQRDPPEYPTLGQYTVRTDNTALEYNTHPIMGVVLPGLRSKKNAQGAARIALVPVAEGGLTDANIMDNLEVRSGAIAVGQVVHYHGVRPHQPVESLERIMHLQVVHEPVRSVREASSPFVAALASIPMQTMGHVAL